MCMHVHVYIIFIYRIHYISSCTSYFPRLNFPCSLSFSALFSLFSLSFPLRSLHSPTHCLPLPLIYHGCLCQCDQAQFNCYKLVSAVNGAKSRRSSPSCLYLSLLSIIDQGTIVAISCSIPHQTARHCGSVKRPADCCSPSWRVLSVSRHTLPLSQPINVSFPIFSGPALSL